jgi:hypothetical protein
MCDCAFKLIRQGQTKEWREKSGEGEEIEAEVICFCV